MRHILFGDSIGFGVGDFEKGGWATQLRLFIDQDKKKKDNNLINLSVSGDTTRDLLARFESETKVRIRPGENRDNYTLLLAIGTNDARIDKANPGRDIPIEEYQSNLEKLITLANPFYAKIVVIGFPPVDEARTLSFKEQNFYYNENIEKYNQIAGAVTKKNGCLFIDLYPLWKDLDVTSLSYDGLHPNTAGHELLFEQIRAILFP